MADKIKLQVVPASLQKTLRKLDRVHKLSDGRVAKVLETGAYDIRHDAKTTLVDYGVLRSSIEVFRVNKLSFGVGTNVLYSPYIEFGTGNQVDVPPGYEAFAIQFKGKGIKQVNRPAFPYLIPAFEKNKHRVIKGIINVLRDITK